MLLKIGVALGASPVLVKIGVNCAGLGPSLIS